MQFGWSTYCDSYLSISEGPPAKPLIYLRIPFGCIWHFRSVEWPGGILSVAEMSTSMEYSVDLRWFCRRSRRCINRVASTQMAGLIHTAVETAFVDCGKILQGGIHIIHKLLWITQNYVKEWYLHNFFHIMWISPWINRPDSSTDTLKTLYLLGFRMVKKGKNAYCQTCQTIL